MSIGSPVSLRFPKNRPFGLYWRGGEDVGGATGADFKGVFFVDKFSTGSPNGRPFHTAGPGEGEGPAPLA